MQVLREDVAGGAVRFLQEPARLAVDAAGGLLGVVRLATGAIAARDGARTTLGSSTSCSPIPAGWQPARRPPYPALATVVYALDW